MRPDGSHQQDGLINSNQSRQDIGDVDGWQAFAARIRASLDGKMAAGQSTGSIVESGRSSELAAAPADPEEDIFALEVPAPCSNAELEDAAHPVNVDSRAKNADQVSSSVLDEHALTQSAAAGRQSATSITGHQGPAGPEIAGRHPQGHVAWEASSGADELSNGLAASVPDGGSGMQEPSAVSEACRAPSLASAHHADSPSMDGFEYDAASGYYYNSLLGCFYDPLHRLFGDASSGHWFSLVDGKYQLVA
jgi:hypothetical protein